MLNIQNLIDDAKCYDVVRHMRWPTGVRCPHCDGVSVTKQGFDETQRDRQRYRCEGCGRRFDDLTGTILAGHHQPLRVWVMCLYFMGLNLSNQQIARELGLHKHDVSLRSGLLASVQFRRRTRRPLDLGRSIVADLLGFHRLASFPSGRRQHPPARNPDESDDGDDGAQMTKEHDQRASEHGSQEFELPEFMRQRDGADDRGKKEKAQTSRD